MADKSAGVCPYCKGQGWAMQTTNPTANSTLQTIMTECRYCNGTGRLHGAAASEEKDDG